MRKTFEFIKNIKIVRPLDSKVDYETTIGEYYEGACDDIDKGISQLEKLEKVVEIISKKVMPLVSFEPKGNLGNGYYVYDAELYLYKEITKEEYELLKEILR